MREITLTDGPDDVISIRVHEEFTLVVKRVGSVTDTHKSAETPETLILKFQEDGYKLYSDRTF
ncbi:hypothetical protein [Actinomadura oligospora]|uniref:hypothetical protein n=1 Tax=Actinomadura oligospora TaxID=111804 RepID=UPI00047E88CB|nr:hypothetical protein [Actinomadura oligospora]